MLLNVDGIIIYTKTHVTKDNGQIGQIYLGREELQVRRMGRDAMLEQDTVHIGYEADVTAHLLDTNEKNIAPTQSGSSQCNADKDMGKDVTHQEGYDTDELEIGNHQPRNHLRGREISNNSLPNPNVRTEPMDEFSRSGEPDDSDPGSDFVRNFYVMINHDNGLIRI